MRDSRIQFATVLINTKCMKAYTWYELRFKIDKDNIGIDKLINNRNYEALLNILLKKCNLSIPNKTNPKHLWIVQEICESIIADDELIVLEEDKSKKLREKFILALIDLVDPYSNERQGNIQIVASYKSAD